MFQFGENMKVLLVDDSADMRKLVELFLKMMSHEVDVAGNGQVAVDKIQSQSYDVILMDMRMPIMDGYDATMAIRSYEKLEGKTRTPIVALTSFSMKEEIEKSLRVGCDCHLAKPINRESLEKVLSELKTQPQGEAPDPDYFDERLFKVYIEPDIKDLVPLYIEKRKDDLNKMKELFKDKNYEELRSMGHKIKGSGGGYGFQGLTMIGARIEMSAKEAQLEALQRAIELFQTYLEKVEINYE